MCRVRRRCLNEVGRGEKWMREEVGTWLIQRPERVTMGLG